MPEAPIELRWYLAVAYNKKSVKSLKKALALGVAPRVLSERVGRIRALGVIAAGKDKNSILAAIQLRRVGKQHAYKGEDDYGLDLTLKEEYDFRVEKDWVFDLLTTDGEISREWVATETRRPLLVRAARELGLDIEDESLPNLRRQLTAFIDQVETKGTQNIMAIIAPPRPPVAPAAPPAPRAPGAAPKPPAPPGPARPPGPPKPPSPPAAPPAPKPPAPPGPPKAAPPPASAPPAPPKAGALKPPSGKPAAPPAAVSAPPDTSDAAVQLSAAIEDLNVSVGGLLEELRSLQFIVYGVAPYASLDKEGGITVDLQAIVDAGEQTAIDVAWVFGFDAADGQTAVNELQANAGKLLLTRWLNISHGHAGEMTGVAPSAEEEVSEEAIRKAPMAQLKKWVTALGANADEYEAAFKGNLQGARDWLLEQAGGQAAPGGETQVGIGDTLNVAWHDGNTYKGKLLGQSESGAFLMDMGDGQQQEVDPAACTPV